MSSDREQATKAGRPVDPNSDVRAPFGPFFSHMSDETRAFLDAQQARRNGHAKWTMLISIFGAVPGLVLLWSIVVMPALAAYVDTRIEVVRIAFEQRLKKLEDAVQDIHDDLKRAVIVTRENKIAILVKELFELEIQMKEQDGTMDPELRKLRLLRIQEIKRQVGAIEGEIARMQREK